MKAIVATSVIDGRHGSKSSPQVIMSSLKQASQMRAKIVPISELKKLRHRKAQ